MAPTKSFTLPFVLVFGLTKLAMSCCPAGFTYTVDGIPKCYSVVTQPLSWEAAQAKCGQLHRNGHLAVVNSAVENQIIQEILKDFECSTSTTATPNSNAFWTSGRRTSDSCNSPFHWKARINQAQTMPYTNWIPGEPNCSFNQEYCLGFVKESGANIQWNDFICSWKMCSVCEVVKFQK